MIKIQITSPFRYQYRTSDYDTNVAKDKVEKDTYFTAGEWYHLDPKKDKDEIKFVLSPNFTFKNYIYVNLGTVPEDLQEELQLESGFYEDKSVPHDEYIPTLLENNKVVQPIINDELYGDPQPTTEPEVNIFDQTSKVIKEPVEEIKEEKLGAENTPDLAPLEKPSEDVVDLSVDNKEREVRKAELSEMHYTKVQEVAELYNLQYKTKKESIEEILYLEFGDSDAEFSTNLEVKN
jgi:hypothetical protein